MLLAPPRALEPPLLRLGGTCLPLPPCHELLPLSDPPFLKGDLVLVRCLFESSPLLVGERPRFPSPPYFLQDNASSSMISSSAMRWYTSGSGCTGSLPQIAFNASAVYSMARPPPNSLTGLITDTFLFLPRNTQSLRC